MSDVSEQKAEEICPRKDRRLSQTHGSGLGPSPGRLAVRSPRQGGCREIVSFNLIKC
jgi:hypothetical protein